MTIRIIALIGAGLMLSACGGPPNLTCDEVEAYQLVTEGQRVKAPEGLDDLDPLREIAVPEASPRPERPPGSPCIDLPPGATSMQGATERLDAEDSESDESDESDESLADEESDAGDPDAE